MDIKFTQILMEKSGMWDDVGWDRAFRCFEPRRRFSTLCSISVLAVRDRFERVWSFGLDFDRTGWNRWTSHRSRIERQGAEGFETVCFGWIWRFSKLSCLKSFEAAAAKSEQPRESTSDQEDVGIKRNHSRAIVGGASSWAFA